MGRAARLPGRPRLGEVHRHAIDATTAPSRNQPGDSLDLSGESCDELGAGVDAELAVDLREVPFDGLRADDELARDLVVGATGGDEFNDPPFCLGQGTVRDPPPADP